MLLKYGTIDKIIKGLSEPISARNKKTKNTKKEPLPESINEEVAVKEEEQSFEQAIIKIEATEPKMTMEEKIAKSTENR